MIIRSVTPEDYKKVAEIHDKYWKGHLEIPSQAGRITEIIVEDDNGEYVTYAMMKLWAEIMMIMDQSQSQKNKIEALKLLAQAIEMTARKNNLTEYHVFTNNQSYADILMKHFGFQHMDTLVLRKILE